MAELGRRGGPEEFRGNYPESELVEDLLGKGEAFDLLQFQMAQNAVSLQHQVQQNSIQDQRFIANATQAFVAAMLGKITGQFPKAVVEDVHSESVSKTVNDDSALTTAQSTLDDFSKVTDAVNDLRTQLMDVVSALGTVELAGK